MAVAMQNSAETKTAASPLALGVASLFGALYVFLAFLIAYHWAPMLWAEHVRLSDNQFVNYTVLFLIQLAIAVGAVLLWPRLVPPRPGIRAGIFLAFFWLGLGTLLLYWLALFVEWLLPKFGVAGATLFWSGVVVAGMFAFLWLRFVWRRFNAPTFEKSCGTVEEQGWFTTKPYKRGQGLKARRGTMLGVILIVAAGLWGYYERTGLKVGELWAIDLPFTADYEVPILRSYGIAVLAVVSAVTLWFAYRLVNYPRFADFLIATEAEMHKVHWTSKARLYQDTVVVLVFMVLLAVILLIMDIFWSFILKNLIGVLQ
jgi:preprotein translocase SecE subunit